MRRKGAVRIGLAALAVLAVLGVGCGDGDETTTSLTKAQFLKQGNALCKELEADRGKAVNDIISNLKKGEILTDARQTKMVETIIIPNYEEAINGLEELGAPKGDEAKINELIKAMEKTQKTLEEDPEEAVFNTLMFEKPNKLAREYGLTACFY